jgi:hypothetical protein
MNPGLAGKVAVVGDAAGPRQHSPVPMFGSDELHRRINLLRGRWGGEGSLGHGFGKRIDPRDARLLSLNIKAAQRQ